MRLYDLIVKQFSPGMAEFGFLAHTDGLFTKELPEGWGAWISLADDSGSGRLIIGASNLRFYQLLDYCLKPIQNQRYKIAKKSYLDTAIYLASPECIEGHQELDNALRDNPDSIARFWLDVIDGYILNWLASSTNYNVCLKRLESYCYTMQIYRYHKAILLRLLDQEEELEAFLTEWKGSLANASELVNKNSTTFMRLVTSADLTKLD